ncbi:hypothetical protein [Caudoviricetes sp.]|nr:hypothetical protein [Caudoviricetes sp.]
MISQPIYLVQFKYSHREPWKTSPNVFESTKEAQRYVDYQKDCDYDCDYDIRIFRIVSGTFHKTSRDS